MNMITSQIIEDSISVSGVRLITLQLCYPRFIHSEFMTHRVFSRNASSSRAIPAAKLLEQVSKNPAMPIHWGKNIQGMQAKEELSHDAMCEAKHTWLEASKHVALYAKKLSELGLHKQVVNRLIEPFTSISVIVSSTEWDNFFDLRNHEDAQPEIKELAMCMSNSIAESTPVERGSNRCIVGNWHLPYVKEQERNSIPIFDLVKISAARCARVSYLTHDGVEPSVKADLNLFSRLVGSKPIHASPIEHQAHPYVNGARFYGNFRGWVQFRKIFESGKFPT